MPVVSAKQMLTWLDGRNGSSFEAIGWSGSVLTFGIAVGRGRQRAAGDAADLRAAAAPSPA